MTWAVQNPNFLSAWSVQLQTNSLSSNLFIKASWPTFQFSSGILQAVAALLRNHICSWASQFVGLSQIIALLARYFVFSELYFLWKVTLLAFEWLLILCLWCHEFRNCRKIGLHFSQLLLGQPRMFWILMSNYLIQIWLSQALV